MTGKILVLVWVPLIERDFEFYIPLTKKIGTIKNLICSIVEENSDGIFVNDNTKYLYEKDSGDLLDDNIFVKNSTLVNGSKLILF